MSKPSPDLMALLSPAERAAFAIAERVNRGPTMKRAATAYLRRFACQFVRSGSCNLLHQVGIENLAALDPDRGVLVASNHRSFFDLYVISDQMLRTCSWIDSMYFPVRSEFFYTQASGTVVNAAMSALAMYPPIFRDPAKRPLNEHAVAVLKEKCSRAGAVIGIHPEGTRGMGDDPYTLLPAKAGTGEIIFHARPIVVPVFLLGIGNALGKQIKSNWDGSGEPITVCYGKPMDLSSYFDRPATPETYLAISQAVRDVIADLGQRERELRKERGLPPPRSYKVRPAEAAPDLGATAASSAHANDRGSRPSVPSSPASPA